MQPMVNIALKAARKAGQYLCQAFDRGDPLQITSKGRNDFVTQVDQKSEAILVESLLTTYPDHGILTEESGQIGNASSEYQWIIDPLDGTTNFIHGIPHFAISIAVKKNQLLEHAVVLNPMLQEEFSASRGHGAQLNGKRLRVSSCYSLESALLATGFPFHTGNLEYLEANLAMLKQFLPQTAGIRRAGAAALDLAYVAAGRYDGYWEFGLKPWDIAAGALLIQEAGGLIGDPLGGHQHMEAGHLVCGNPKLFKLLLQALRPNLPDNLRFN